MKSIGINIGMMLILIILLIKILRIEGYVAGRGFLNAD